MERTGTAMLSSKGEYSFFRFRDRTITFYTGKELLRYTSVKEWDRGYLVVMCQNKHCLSEEEDYIDLSPILENLYIEKDEFLEPIKGVEVVYDGECH